MAQLLESFSQSQKETLRRITELLEPEGAELYLVGGCVRDSLLGIPPKDIDIEVFRCESPALVSRLREQFKIDCIGKSFGVYHIAGQSIDISLPRKESKTGLKHTDFKIEGDPFMQPEEAASRRDFTLNAIYYHLQTETLFDPFQGVQDLSERRLRHCSTAFIEDPLRVLRAMQFIARFRLNVAPETLALCRSLNPQHIPKERIWDEWKKLLLKGEAIGLGLQFLSDCDWLQYFPQLQATIDCPQDPEWHPEGSVWEHTKLCMDAFARARIGDEWEDLIVGLATLCHDLGKVVTTERSEDGRIRSPQHAIKGLPIAKSFLQLMTDQKKVFDEVLPLVSAHMQPQNLYKNNSGDAAIRRLAAKVQRIDRLVRLARADHSGRSPQGLEDCPIADWLIRRSEDLKLRSSAPQALIQGRDLIAHQLEPSPEFSKILTQCYEAQLDGVFDDAESAQVYLKRFLKDQKYI